MILLVPLLLQSCHSEVKQDARPLNILFIMSDDHASRALSCYGSEINQTPNLDRLASEGTMLTNCFVTNSICAPSRASIITGKYGHVHGKVTNILPFNGDQVTYPKLLQAAGYETAMIGKWHLDPEPRGFTFWKILTGYNGQGNYYNPEFNEMGNLQTYNGYVTNLITDFAIEWLESRDKSKPFCLLYQHKAPHGPWLPDTAHLSLYRDTDIPVPDNYFDNFEHRDGWYLDHEGSIARFMDPRSLKTEHLDKGHRLNNAQREAFIKAYEPENREMRKAGLSGKDLALWKYQRYIKDYLRTVQSVDENVGRMLDYLEESGLADNTIVIYTSDQGFFLGEHGFWDKRLMFEESIRMPFLIRIPGMKSPGSVCDDMILNIDFAPTLLDYAGVGPLPEMQGRSFRNNLEGKTPGDWRISMYYHYYEYPGWHMVKRHYGIRTERYKLIHYYFDIDEWELYDLERDPHEMHDRFDDPDYAAIVRQLQMELDSLRAYFGDSDALNQKYLEEQPGELLDIPQRTRKYPQFEHLRRKH